MKSLTERLRYTASRGTSVWGDLQMEAADTIERLTEVEQAHRALTQKVDTFVAQHYEWEEYV